MGLSAVHFGGDDAVSQFNQIDRYTELTQPNFIKKKKSKYSHNKIYKYRLCLKINSPIQHYLHPVIIITLPQRLIIFIQIKAKQYIFT